MGTQEISDIDLSEASFTATLKDGRGKTIPKEEYLLISLDIRREVNRIPKAVLVFMNSGTSPNEDQIGKEPYFFPGKQIEVKLHYETEKEDEAETAFKGVVVKNSLTIKLRRSKFTVELRDVAAGLTRPRKSAVFVNKSDDDIFWEIVKAANIDGLTYTKKKQGKTHDQVVQHYCTDWDFIVSRAEAQGRLVVVNDGKLSVRKVDLDPGTKNKHKLTLGKNAIYDLEFSVNAGQQCPEEKDNKSHAWDFDNQKSESVSARVFKLEQGNDAKLEGKELAEAMGFQPTQLSSFASLKKDELQDWADGHMMRSRLSMIQGRMEVLGSAKYKLLDVVEIDKLGARYDGTAVITGICHRADINGWNTDIQFGLSARPFSLEDDILDAPASGLLPGVNGLHIGVVDKFDKESKKSLQVKVNLPGLKSSGKESSVWARLAVPDAGKDHGWFFYPEPGDEVVVGFFNDDPRQPVILGSLYSTKNKPPSLPGGEVNSITSKKGATIGFINCEQEGSVFMESKGMGLIVIDDQEKKLRISDQNGNEIIMSEDGIHLKTEKDFKLEAKGNVEIKSGKSVEIKGNKVNIN